MKMTEVLTYIATVLIGAGLAVLMAYGIMCCI